MSEIARLVDAGQVDTAVAAAAGLSPRHVAELLFASGGYSNDMRPYDAFFRRWYQTLDDPFIRAAAAERFGDAYLTELAGVPGGEEFAARLVEESVRAVVRHLASLMRGPEIGEWAEPHVAVMTASRAAAWRHAADELMRVHLPG